MKYEVEYYDKRGLGYAIDYFESDSIVKAIELFAYYFDSNRLIAKYAYLSEYDNEYGYETIYMIDKLGIDRI